MLSQPRPQRPKGSFRRGQIQPQAPHFRRIFRHDAGRSQPYGQCDPRPCHGRRREGEIGSSGPADGRRRHGDRAVHAIPEIRRRRAGLAGPRPLRALGRARLDADLFAAVSDRQPRDDDRPAQGLSPVGIADTRTSRARPHQGHRDHHRSARPGHFHRRRHGARREDARRRVRQEDCRSPYLCDRFRRRFDGRRVAGSDRVGRALEAQQADRAL
ncbi:hypothetical protein ACVWZK_008888 [Bradyrhizobium sp. GM0.4]